MNIQQLLDAAEPASRYVPTATAELITGLANAVRQLTKQRDAVVADNAGLKSALTAILQPGEATLSREHRAAAVAAIETPATSAILDSLRAEGVEMFARALRVPGDDPFMDDIAVGVAGTADNFAHQLRESKGANHE